MDIDYRLKSKLLDLANCLRNVPFHNPHMCEHLTNAIALGDSILIDDALTDLGREFMEMELPNVEQLIADAVDEISEEKDEDYRRLESDYDDLMEEKCRRESENDALSNRISELEDMVDRKEDEIGDLENALEAEADERADLRETICNLESEVRDLGSRRED